MVLLCCADGDACENCHDCNAGKPAQCDAGSRPQRGTEQYQVVVEEWPLPEEEQGCGQRPRPQPPRLGCPSPDEDGRRDEAEDDEPGRGRPEVEEVAERVTWLVRDDAAGLNGQTLALE